MTSSVLEVTPKTNNQCIAVISSYYPLLEYVVHRKRPFIQSQILIATVEIRTLINPNTL